MSESRSLFLIDGSNQMYRAYHAIRGLTGPDGRSTNAVYGFITMLRKLLADHQPGVHRGVVRSAVRHVPRCDLGGLQGQPRADARRPQGADSVGARGLRSDGRAHPHAPRATKPTTSSGRWPIRRQRRVFRSRSSPATRTSSNSWEGSFAPTTPRTKARGSTRPACRRSSACRPAKSSMCSPSWATRATT